MSGALPVATYLRTASSTSGGSSSRNVVAGGGASGVGVGSVTAEASTNGDGEEAHCSAYGGRCAVHPARVQSPTRMQVGLIFVPLLTVSCVGGVAAAACPDWDDISH